MNKNNKKQSPLPLLTDNNPLRALFSLAEYYPDRSCMAEPRGNMVRKYRLREFTALIEKIARVVALSRHRSSKPIAIIAHSSFRAVVAHLGALLAGGKVVLISTNASVEQQLEIIADNQVELLVVDAFSSVQPLLAHLPHLPQLRQLWSLEDEPADYPNEVSAQGWQDILELAASKKPILDQQFEKLNSDAPACRYYERNEAGDFHFYESSLKQMAQQVVQAQQAACLHYPNFKETTRFLAVIPFNQPVAHIEGILLPLLTGRSLMALDRQEAWRSGVLPYAPDCLVASSVFLNQASERILSSVAESGGIAQLSLQQNLNRLRRLQKHRKTRRVDGTSMINFIAGKAVNYLTTQKLRDVMGGDIQLSFCIDQQLTEKSTLFYHSIALPVMKSALAKQLQFLTQSPQEGEGTAFHAVRGTQLAQNEEIKSFQIMGL